MEKLMLKESLADLATHEHYYEQRFILDIEYIFQ
jgi:hypothetical protein